MPRERAWARCQLNTARTKPVSAADRSRRSPASTARSRHGTDSVHCRYGAHGSTRSTRCAAASAMRRPRHNGHTARPLQENASSRSNPQSTQRTRTVREDAAGEVAPQLALDVPRHAVAVAAAVPRLGEEALEVLAHHRVQHRRRRCPTLVRTPLDHAARSTHTASRGRAGVISRLSARVSGVPHPVPGQCRESGHGPDTAAPALDRPPLRRRRAHRARDPATAGAGLGRRRTTDRSVERIAFFEKASLGLRRRRPALPGSPRPAARPAAASRDGR